MALSRLQYQDLDRWIQNGHSWRDPDNYNPYEDDDYAYLDEDGCTADDYDTARGEDLYDD